MKAYRRLPILLVVLAVGTLAVGCGGLGAGSGGKELTLGYIAWDENVAISSLTKVLLEEELGYERVELQRTDVAVASPARSNPGPTAGSRRTIARTLDSATGGANTVGVGAPSR